MTAGAEAASLDLSDIPVCTLAEPQLGDLELLLSGAFAPLTGFMTAADATAVADSWQLADGAAFPAQVTLDVAAEALPAGTGAHGLGRLLLADPEGTPLAVMAVREVSPVPESSANGASGPRQVRLAGPVTANRAPEHGPFRRLMLSPADCAGRLGDGPVLAFATRSPLTSRQIGQLRHHAGLLRAQLLLLPLVSGRAEVVGTPQALVRAVLAAAASLPAGTLVVPVPLAARPDASTSADGRVRETAMRARVAAAYGATHMMTDGTVPGGTVAASTGPMTTGPMNTGPGSTPSEEDRFAAAAVIPVVPGGDWAYDPQAEVWRPHGLIEPGTEQEDLSADQLGDLLDAGSDIPSWVVPTAVARELQRVRRPRSRRGIVLFLTGLSGSGKSTIARDLADVLAERGDRQVSLLDGDLVRQLLSAGLAFTRADRDLNIARIGFVAAEVARHGGIAICAPIAPYAAARARVRQMVSEVGDFFLVHVATPLQVCEARDRKGLYARARAGAISHFTGVSDPYEEPADAELVIDTSAVSRAEAVQAVLGMLIAGGWLAAEPR